jgi:membrane protease YdiL (CAAX protease family)
VRHATVDARWVRRWRNWASWSISVDVIVLGALAVVVDMASAWEHLEIGWLGGIPVSPALPIALLLIARMGVRVLGLSRPERDAWREYLVCMGAFLTLVAVMFAVRVASVGTSVGVIVAAFGEEAVYRLGAVVAVGAVCAHLMGREWRTPARWGLAPGLVGLSVAAILFSVLPGHVEQMSGGMTILPFASLSLLLGYVVLRTGSLWPAVMTHSLLNLITLIALARHEPSGLRLVFAAATLGSLIIAADLAGRRLGRVGRVPSVIDLEAIDDGSMRIS